MPILPYAISGLIYDTDGSTGLSSTNIRVYNLRTGEVLTTTSASDGSYSVTFETYEDKDFIYIEARKTISSQMEKFGIGSVEIDTSQAGLTKNIYTNLIINRGIETTLLRAPIQEREDRMFSPDYNALRVIPTGFDTEDVTITRDANNYITTVEETDGIHIKKTSLTRDANNLITSIVERIK